MLNLDIEIPLVGPEGKIGNALYEIRPEWNLKDVTYKVNLLLLCGFGHDMFT